jgi:hypothetical protein
MLRSLKHLTIFPALSLMAVQATAQKTLPFNGSYVNALGEGGTAHYNYYLDGDRPVPHGKFRFTASYVDSVQCNRHISRSANGEYAHGRKQGKWAYESRDLNVTVERMDGLRPITRTDGNMVHVALSFKNGSPSGSLTYLNEDVVNSLNNSTVRKGTAEFDNGKPVGSFSYVGERRDRTVRGRFDKDGNYDGDWVITDSDSSGTYRDERTYRNGFLLHLKLKRNDSLLHDIFFTDVTSKLDQLAQGDTTGGFAIGPRSFGVAFDDGYTPGSTMITAQQMGNAVIMRAQHMMFGHQSEPYAYFGLDTFMFGSTRRFIYTYSAQEEEALLLSSALVDSLKAASDRYLENRALMMNRQKSDSLAFSYGWLLTLQGKLGQLRKAVDKLASDEFRYQDRTNYFRDGIACASDVDSVRYDFDGEERIRLVRNEACVIDGSDVIRNIHRFLMVLHGHLTATSSFLDAELRLIKKEQQLSETEERILSLTDSVFVLYTGRTETDGDNNGNGFNGHASALHRSVFRNMMGVSRKRMMQDYSNMEMLAEKQDKGLRILELLTAMIEAHPRLTAITGMPAALDEVFTTYEYNPYMGRHDIKVRKKKRLYEKGVLDLMTYLTAALETVQDPKVLAERIDEIVRMNDRLTELAKLPESETAKLDKRLRTETDPERIKRVLEP